MIKNFLWGVTNAIQQIIPPKEKLRLHKYQRLICQSTALFVTILCSRRFGKTTMAVRQAIHRHRKYGANELDCYIVTPTFKHCRKTYWSKIVNNYPKEFIAKIDNSNCVIEDINGGKLVLLGFAAIWQVRGNKFHTIIIDETSECKHIEEQFAEAVLPAALDAIDIGQIWFMGTALAGTWFEKLCTEIVQREAHKITPNNRFLYNHFQYDIYQCPQYSIAQIETILAAQLSIGGQDKVNQEFFNKFISPQGRLYTAFVKQAHTNDLRKELYEFIHSNQDVYLAMDFNVGHLAVNVLKLVTTVSNQTIVQHKIKCLSATLYNDIDVNKLIRTLKKEWNTQKRNVYVLGDPRSMDTRTTNDITTHTYKFKQNGFIVIDVDYMNQLERVSHVNALLDNNLIEINNHEAALLIRDFDTVEKNTRGSGLIDKSKENKGYNHLADAFGYGAYMLIPPVKYTPPEIVATPTEFTNSDDLLIEIDNW